MIETNDEAQELEQQTPEKPVESGEIEKQTKFIKGMDQMNENEGGDKRKQYLYKLLIDEITAWNERQEKKIRLHIYLAYLKLSCYENHLSALYELMCASELSPSIYEEFLIFRLM